MQALIASGGVAIMLLWPVQHPVGGLEGEKQQPVERSGRWSACLGKLPVNTQISGYYNCIEA